ncbi:MAG: serine protease, partial [Actinomycetota bacterium]|jgi:serine protease
VSRASDHGSFITVKAPRVDIVKNALGHLPGIAYVEDNALMYATATPNDSQYGSQYGPPMMGFPAAWTAAGYGSSAITVSIIDSGILKTHQDLAGPRILQGHDYVNNDADPDDTCGHGTHTAGTVGATTNNALGVAGMSQVKILEMKTLQYQGGIFGASCSGSTAGIAQAIIDSADQGAKVISMSIGGGSSSAMQNAVNYAWGKGVILVAAAGNDGGTNSIDYPGAYPNVIAVGALDSNKARASYSDRGPQLDVMAPGSNVLSTYTGANNATYSSLSGTSMATPHVAGAIALALGCNTGKTPTDVVNALFSTAENLGAAGYDTTYGWGLARADLLVANVCGGSPPPPPPPPPGNAAPTAAFTATASGTLGVAVNGSSSSDPDGDALTYAWTWGDSTAGGTGVTASHTYAAAGTYTIGLTVNDGHAHTASTSTSFTVNPPSSDPDPSTPNVTSGQNKTIALSSSNPDTYFKINVPSGKGQLRVALTGPSCGFFGFSCPVDGDLYTRFGARPTDTTYACRPFLKGNAETCTTANPSAGYWYLRVKRAAGSGNVNLTATIS